MLTKMLKFHVREFLSHVWYLAILNMTRLCLHYTHILP